MSLFSSLGVSLSGLQAITTQMQIASNNIVNASNEGYTRKSAVTQAVTLGQEGGGTQVIGFKRASNDALATTLRKATSDSSLRSTQNDYLQQIENILGSTDSTNPLLSTSISAFADAWRSLASAPEDNVSQRQVVQTAKNLVSVLQNTSASIDELDTQCANDINNSLSDLNSTLVNIVDLNKKISLGLSAAVNVGNLEDERDQMVQKVAEYMNVVVMERPQGQIALYTPGGYMLIDGGCQSFSYDGTNVTSHGDPNTSLNYALTGGKIQALVSFRATSTPPSTDPATNVIQKIRSQIDGIVNAFIEVSAGPPESFASAYNGIASATVTNGITFSSQSSGTFGNGISVQIADTGGGTFSATIHVDGQSDEVYTGLNNLGSGFWTNLADAINHGGGVPAAPASRLITATVNGTGAATPAAATYTLAGGHGNSTNGQASNSILSNGVANLTVQSNCISYFANTTGEGGNNISVMIEAGSDATHYNVTITDGTTTELYTDVADDSGGGGNTFWVNLEDAINNGGNASHPDVSSLITATAGVGTDAPAPADLGVAQSLTGGGPSGETCLTLTALDAGTDGNDLSVVVSQGTDDGTYKVTVKLSGQTVETFDNIDNSGDGLWANIADAINQGQAGPPAVAASIKIMATTGTGTMLPATGSSTTYTLKNGTDELQSSFFSGTDVATFSVNADLFNGTKTIKIVSPPLVGDAFNAATRRFSADGISVTGVSYETMAASVLTSFQQAASNIGSLNDTATSQKDYLQQRLTNETAVNIDDETVMLTTLQNAYAATAHIIQVINKLFDILENI